MKTAFAFLVCLICAGSVLADSLYPVEGSNNSIYTEKRARRVGDVVTVMIQEQDQATQGVTTGTQKNASVGLGAGLGVYEGYNNIPTQNQIGVGGQSYTQGQGSSARA